MAEEFEHADPQAIIDLCFEYAEKTLQLMAVCRW